VDFFPAKAGRAAVDSVAARSTRRFYHLSAGAKFKAQSCVNSRDKHVSRSSEAKANTRSDTRGGLSIQPLVRRVLEAVIRNWQNGGNARAVSVNMATAPQLSECYTSRRSTR